MVIATRKMHVDVVPAVIAIERQSFALAWTKEMFEEELKGVLSWREVAETERGEVAGFLIGRSYPDAWHLMDLAVAPWARRRGVAARLLRAFVRAADDSGRPLFLEVRPGNAEALALYRKWGFSRVGARKRYYSDTGEDALVMMRKHGMWTEIVYLVVPTLNDDDQQFTGVAKWVKAELGVDVPVHFTRFHPEYLLKNLPPTPVKTLERAKAIADAEGLHFVYVGNVPGHPGENTYCPKCRRVVVERAGFTVNSNHLRKGRCRYCQQAVPGVWDA